mmetsp:Transcript_50529/g.134392  ORF Transcript_50529/g.134392 Transcript_50529/m.134392 type:complete len:470 (-) Transcript_50529:129-1538(-)
MWRSSGNPTEKTDACFDAQAVDVACAALSRSVASGNRLQFDAIVVALRAMMPRGPRKGGVLEGSLEAQHCEWQDHCFAAGPEDNLRTLQGFQATFARRVACAPDGFRNPSILASSLDLAGACSKCHALDAAEYLYEAAQHHCMERDVPWKARYLQDVAALRCKQLRQLDAVACLRRLVEIVPNDVGARRSLSLVYSQLGDVEEAIFYLQEPRTDDLDDLWCTALVRQSTGEYVDAAQMLGRALQLHEDTSPADTVTEAKIRCSLGSCLDLMGRHPEALQHLTKAQSLLMRSVGADHPLYGGVCEALSLAMVHAGMPKDAFDMALTAFAIRASAESIHPTALFELLTVALEDCVDAGGVDPRELARLEEPMGVAVASLHLRRMDRDANAAILFERASQVLVRCSQATGGKEQQTNAARRRSRARKLLQRASSLLVDATSRGEANFAHTRELIALQFEVLDVQDAIWQSKR